MLKTWVIYFITLLSTFIFFLFSKMWVAWYCLIALLLVPVFALIVAVAASLTLHVKTETPGATTKGKQTYIKLTVEGILSVFSFYKLKWSIVDHMGGTRKKEVITIYDNGVTMLPLETEHCGAYTYKLGKLKVYDIRDYQLGDSVKTIHWKMSAKKEKLLVKEPLEEYGGYSRVILKITDDHSLPQDLRSSPTEMKLDHPERTSIIDEWNVLHL